MKKISTVAVTGLLYLFFVYSFSFFDSIGFFENLLYKLGLKGTVETVKSVGDGHAFSLPEPPYPPPPPP